MNQQSYLCYPQPPQNTEPQVMAYPVDAFPPILRDVINALSRDVQAPIELVAGTVLSAVSLACQACIKIRFPDGRLKPCSLYNIVLAGSGERKSAIYSLVMQPFLDYEKEQVQDFEKALKKYNTQLLLWKNKQKIIMKKITKKMKDEEDYEYEEYELQEHGSTQPVKPRKIKLIYSDTTPEALQYGIYENSPSAGLMSDEASVFFTGRAKNNLGFLNLMWDGSPFDVERRGSDSFSVEGYFSMLLMIQPDLFMQYFMKHGKVARGSGFLSRFLISSVSTMQGGRNSTYQSNNREQLSCFYYKINYFLSKTSDYIRSNEVPKELRLSLNCQSVFSRFQEHIENLIVQNKNEAITAFLAKAPENLVRLAALLQYFHNEKESEISNSIFNEAITIIDYYVIQSISLYKETLASPEQDADFLFSWILSFSQKNNSITTKINKSYVRRFISRTHMRNNNRLNTALKMLIDQGRISIEYEKNQNGSISEIICLHFHFDHY